VFSFYIDILSDIYEKLSTQKLKPVQVAETFPLEKIREAHRTLETHVTSCNIGKIVITLQ
jgi:hypothetical protein